MLYNFILCIVGMFHPNGGMFPPGYYGPYSHMMPIPPFVAASHQTNEEVSTLREQLVTLLLLFYLHYF